MLVPLAALSACATLPSGQTSLSDALPPPRAMAAEAEQRGDWAAAARHWQSVQQNARTDRAVTLSLVRALRLSGSCGSAQPHLAQMLGTDGRDGDALMEAAKCHLVSGRPEAAEATLATLLDVKPDSWEAHTTMGVALDRTGRTDEALAHHDQAVRLANGKPTALANKGLSLALSGRLDEGLAIMRSAASMPNAPARVRVNLAVLEALAGDGERAATILSQENVEDKVDGIAQLKRMARAAKPNEAHP
jgi:Flp pilus assembly protein TadD